MPSSATEEFRRSWRLILAVTVAICFGLNGLIQYAYGVFINPLAVAFGCSLTSVGAWSSFVSIGVLVAAPFVGRLADRFGVRPVVLTMIPVLAIVLAGVAAIHRGVWLLWLAALATGILGTATGALTYGRAINGWFVRKRGAALGLMSAGVGLSALFGPRLAQGVVDAWGWRAGFLLLGACALVPLPLLILWLREPRDGIGRREPSPETGYALKEAVRLPLFWLMGPASFLWLSCFGGVFFLIPFLSFSGLSRAEAAADAGLLGITTTFGRIATGAIMDWLPAPYVCAFVFLLEAAAFAALALFPTRYVAWSILAIGFAHGTENVGFSYCIARYFGMKSYSAVSGLLNLFSGVGLALAPVVFSSLKELTGAYRVPFLASAGMAAGAGLLYVFVGRQSPVSGLD
jgi:predicted MFS family arabinose efflux permease